MANFVPIFSSDVIRESIWWFGGEEGDSLPPAASFSRTKDKKEVRIARTSTKVNWTSEPPIVDIDTTGADRTATQMYLYSDTPIWMFPTCFTRDILADTNNKI